LRRGEVGREEREAVLGPVERAAREAREVLVWRGRVMAVQEGQVARVAEGEWVVVVRGEPRVASSSVADTSLSSRGWR